MKFVYQFFSFLQHLLVYFRIKIFHRRFFLLGHTGKHVHIKKHSEKIVVVIAHVVPGAQNAPDEKMARLIACLDGLCQSLALFQSKIIILTKEGYSLHENLPEYLKNRIKIFYSGQEDPMYVEFDAYDVFKAHENDYDYFMFLEDDIVLNDSWFLEKIKKFNRVSPKMNYVLLPHRFEYFKGLKAYIDQCPVINDPSRSNKYSEHLKIIADDAVFAVFENAHSAFYCLNKQQMRLWIKSGYKWKNKVAAVGVLESAATFCMYENFEFFKPHPDNMSYFEVQHFGNKNILINF